MFVWQKLFLSTYFTIQLIFATIYGSHCTFWYNSWVPLYYFSEFIHLSTIISVKSFQFQKIRESQTDPYILVQIKPSNNIFFFLDFSKFIMWCARSCRDISRKYLRCGHWWGEWEGPLRALFSKVLKMLNAKCYFLAFLAPRMIKIHLHQICYILKLLALSYSELLSITAHCS